MLDGSGRCFSLLEASILAPVLRENLADPTLRIEDLADSGPRVTGLIDGSDVSFSYRVRSVHRDGRWLRFSEWETITPDRVEAILYDTNLGDQAKIKIDLVGLTRGWVVEVGTMQLIALPDDESDRPLETLRAAS
ncbi:MAG: hypothetical protein EPN91_02415 [Salinibacterium sp.]|nr:MAG: hypothetical protein EPN91_02415 [Salinibacterium sp.]